MARMASCQTVKKPFREVWRAVALQMQSESGDMFGGFGSLAQQGFLTLFPAREAHRAERETVQTLGKGRRRRTFSTRWHDGQDGFVSLFLHSFIFAVLWDSRISRASSKQGA